MRHLFIINPEATGIKGNVANVVDMINRFFGEYNYLQYTIHVTRWSRDAGGFVQRFVKESPGIVRVYAVGGTGTLYEIINGSVGLPNVQIAFYPLGAGNSFVRYFGSSKKHLFLSIRNLVFSGTMPLDLIRCGSRYALNHVLIGLEAESSRDGNKIIGKTFLNLDFCYILSAFYNIIRPGKFGQAYKITLDSTQNLDGEYISMMIAKNPYYGGRMAPAPEARADNGFLDIYLVKKTSRGRSIFLLPAYLSGNSESSRDLVAHYRGKTLTVKSSQVMTVSMDGESSCNTSADIEIIPYAIDFVCPNGIDKSKVSEKINNRRGRCKPPA